MKFRDLMKRHGLAFLVLATVATIYGGTKSRQNIELNVTADSSTVAFRWAYADGFSRTGKWVHIQRRLVGGTWTDIAVVSAASTNTTWSGFSVDQTREYRVLVNESQASE